MVAGRGWSHADPVKCTVMLGDMADWPIFNAVYATYFKAGQVPAHSAFAANGFAHRAKVEVECVAYNPARKEAIFWRRRD